jgi:hypothetical protein
MWRWQLLVGSVTRIASALVLFLATAIPALPDSGQPPFRRPAGSADDSEPLIVTGYRALFTCSAHFFAGRPLDDIKKVELVDVRRTTTYRHSDGRFRKHRHGGRVS